MKYTAIALLASIALVGCNSCGERRVPTEYVATPTTKPEKVPLPGRFVAALQTGVAKVDRFPAFSDPGFTGGKRNLFSRGELLQEEHFSPSQVVMIQYKSQSMSVGCPLRIMVDGIEAPVSWRSVGEPATVIVQDKNVATFIFSVDGTDLVEVLGSDRVIMRLRIKHEHLASDGSWRVVVTRVNDSGQRIDEYGSVVSEQAK